MTLLQKTADTLISHGLADNYQDFSRRYCGLTENYFYRQAHHNRDFSTEGLLNCIVNIRKANKHYDRFSTIFETEIDELGKLESELSVELIKRLKLNDESRVIISACIAN
ncbi:hypothetical protein [Nioella ostreopsis]|jgi:hypothetical protein|uniref:hypothetical protein n=1 Tax=Nioella ostreopsis TaxID=2448479 RepID=UPI000FD80572|nr:hypothetical protein [Nioella ostreopsis]